MTIGASLSCVPPFFLIAVWSLLCCVPTYLSQVGLADYQELAKGQMLGGADGFLKLIFHTETLKLLGVHCIGDGATEIIHIGQASGRQTRRKK